MPNKADSGKSAMTANPFDWSRQWLDLSIKAQQAMTTLLEAQKRSGDLPTQLTQAASAAFGNMYLSLMRDPVALVDAHVDLMRQHAKMWQDVFKPGGEGAQTVTSRDRRFRNEEWEKNLALRALMHSYMIGADWLRSLVDKGELDPADRKKVTFFTEQFIDASSPTNFAFTNPDVLKKTIETGGANLVQGFSNFLDDLLTNAGHVRRADNKAFELGVNIAATKGSVVFRNDMMELIQYEPTTETVRDVPLLLVPPWVNKYYLFDLQQKTSFIGGRLTRVSLSSPFPGSTPTLRTPTRISKIIGWKARWPLYSRLKRRPASRKSISWATASAARLRPPASLILRRAAPDQKCLRSAAPCAAGVEPGAPRVLCHAGPGCRNPQGAIAKLHEGHQLRGLPVPDRDHSPGDLAASAVRAPRRRRLAPGAGVTVSHETIRRWVNHFGPIIATNGQMEDNRSKNSHQPTRRREIKMQRFKRAGLRRNSSPPTPLSTTPSTSDLISSQRRHIGPLRAAAMKTWLEAASAA